MVRRVWGLAVALIAGCLVAAAPAAAETVTALGSSQAEVKPEDKKSNASIKKAIAEARATALPLALANARQRAAELAAGSGLVLGDVESVEEYLDPRFGGYELLGSFGPGQFCGTVTRRVRQRLSDGRVVRRRVRQRRCHFPRFVLTSVEVTYKASKAG